jgi:hypothetical protein
MFGGSAKELRKQPLASLLKAPTEARKRQEREQRAVGE